MKEKELETIRAAIRHARDTIDLLAPHDDNGIITDPQIRSIFYEINSFAIQITKIIDNLPWF